LISNFSIFNYQYINKLSILLELKICDLSIIETLKAILKDAGLTEDDLNL